MLNMLDTKIEAKIIWAMQQKYGYLCLVLKFLKKGWRILLQFFFTWTLFIHGMDNFLHDIILIYYMYGL